MKYKYLLALAIGFFLTLKLFHIGIRASDTNIYFETAHQLLRGKVLYRDIFFTNFPFFSYVSMLYLILTLGHLPLFYLTASVEVAATSVLIFLIVKKQWGSESIATMSSILYLFSFLVLTTSDHQTGVFTASLFAVGSYYLLQRKNYLWSGTLIGLSLMTKAYFLPVALAIFISLFFERSREVNLVLKVSSRQARTIVLFLSGSIIATLLALLPSLILSPHALWHDVFAYSLTRSQGLDKANIAWFFMKHDFPLFCVLVFSFFNFKRQPFFAFLSLFSILFFLLYKDLYYLYLNFLIPFLAIGFPYFYARIQKTFSLQKLVIPSILVIFLVANLIIDQKGYADLGRVTNIDSMVASVQKLHPASLYGMNDITPALSYLTGIPQLDGIIDTNENIYRKGFLSAKTLTSQAIQNHSLLVAHGVIYRDSGINMPLVGEIFDKKQVEKNCALKNKFPVKTEGVENYITFYICR